MKNILNEITKDREEILPIISTISTLSCKSQQQAIEQTRNSILSRIGFEMSERCTIYLRYSDQLDAGFCMSDDRVHGEHHKLDVLKWGLLVQKQLIEKKFSEETAAELLPIVLNEHDEGRRVAGDFEHELKSAVLVRLRLGDYNEYKQNEIGAIANVIGNHSGITKRKNEKYRYNNKIEEILMDSLTIADRISAIDPLRVLAYFLKHVSRNRISIKKAGEQWNLMLKVWQESIESGVALAVKYGLDGLASQIFQEHKSSVKFIEEYAHHNHRNFEEIIKGIRNGNDVRMFNEFFQTSLICLPVYLRSF